jgi:hypothetical protein
VTRVAGNDDQDGRAGDRSAATNGEAGRGRDLDVLRSNDPAVLAAEIERTRAELAETLDAIADKVSPKRVAKRTSQKVKETAHEAAVSVRSTAATARGKVSGKAAPVAAVTVVPDLPPTVDVAAPGVAPTGYVAPVVPPSPAAAAITYSSSGPVIRPQYAAAGALAAVLAVLLIRRVRR